MWSNYILIEIRSRETHGRGRPNPCEFFHLTYLYTSQLDMPVVLETAATNVLKIAVW